jgi:hypothetical protein
MRGLDCALCGRRVERRSRQQRFCSGGCKEKARERVCTSVGYQGSAPSKINAVRAVSSHAPPKFLNEINGGQTAKIRGPGHAIEVEVFGRRWEERISSGGVPIMVAQLRKAALVRGSA